MNFRKILAGVAASLAMIVGFVGVADSGALSNYVVNKTIDSLLRAQTAYTPATVYVALATGSATAASCPNEVTTGTYQNYARVAVTSSLANWNATQGGNSVSTGTTGQTSNINAITFPAPGAGGSATVVVAVCVFDASTSGNLIFQTNLTTSKTINPSDAAPSFSASALSLTIN